MKRLAVYSLIFLLATGWLLSGCHCHKNDDEGRKQKYFVPSQDLSVGLSRSKMDDVTLQKRVAQMIEAQTFVILRDPQALIGVQRITSPKLQRIFRTAARQSGFPQSVLEAISCLESWGNPKAQSPTGPKGIGQIARGTAGDMGLKIEEITKYRIVKERVVSKVKPKATKSKKGKKSSKARTVVRYRTKKIPYTVVVDERLIPSKAIPAMGKYLARLTSELGGQDLAIFAYHCGEGGVRGLVRTAREEEISNPTVPKIFFNCGPNFRPRLYEKVKMHLGRDYSPTYWFRIKRMEELIALYKKSPEQFKSLWRSYQNQIDPRDRTPSRLWVWLKWQDLKYTDLTDLKDAKEKGELVRVFNKPRKFNFSLRVDGRGRIAEKDRVNQDLYLQLQPSAIGAILYIAYETHRLFDACKPNEDFEPLEITSLVRTKEYQKLLSNGNVNARTNFPTHLSGKVFDISYRRLSEEERECLWLVLNDMEWASLLDVTEESKASMTYHIGINPQAEHFFLSAYQEAKEY